MATTPQERVIGGGLLFFGIAVVLLLVYFFGFKGGPTTAETREQLFSDLFPGYEKALERGEYAKARDRATEINEILTGTDSGPLKQAILGEATTNLQYKRFNRLMGKGTFGKNVDNLWEFDGKWYAPATCRDLGALKHTVDDLIGPVVLIDISSRVRAELDKNGGKPSPDPKTTNFSNSSNATVTTKRWKKSTNGSWK